MRSIIAQALLYLVIICNLIGLPSNITYDVLSPNLVVRYVLTDKEMEVMDHVTPDAVANNGSVLGSDSYYISYIQSNADWYWPQKTKVRSIDDYILNGNYKECPYSMIILREALHTEPFAFGNGSIYKLMYDPVEYAVKQGYTITWSNGEVSCLIKSK